MTIYQLQCFVAVAEELNFSAAAARLFTTQPSITYQISALEKETGLHLFERTTRRTKLTPAGTAFYQDIKHIPDYYEASVQKAQLIQTSNHSRLVVGLRKLFDYQSMAKTITRFQKIYPDVVVDIVPQSNHRPLDELRSGKLDIGFFYDTEHSNAPDISFYPLFVMPYHVWMNPKNPLADRKELRLSDLKGQAVVTTDSFESYLYACRGPSLQELMRVGADVSRSVPSLEGALLEIQMNTGMAIIPCLEKAGVPGIARVKLVDFAPVQVEIGALHNSNRADVQMFIEVSKEYYENMMLESIQKR